MTPARTALAALLVIFAVASGAAGVLLVTAAPAATGADAGQLPDAGPVPAGEKGRGVVHRPDERRLEPGAPRRLLIGSAGLRAPVVPVGAGADGQLVIPQEPGTVGWWIGSAPAGARDGSTLLAGHVDSARGGLGALAVLRTLPVGTRMVLTDVFGVRHTYRMAARRTYPKADLPRDLLGGGKRPRLVLVTCGGPFDEARHRYRDNLVVYAVSA